MSWDEHVMLIAHTVNQFGREVKVIGNTGSNSTSEALHATEQVRGCTAQYCRHSPAGARVAVHHSRCTRWGASSGGLSMWARL